MDTQKQEWVDALKVEVGKLIVCGQFDTAEKIIGLIERIYWMQDMENDCNSPEEEA